jgi:hypothetical protein
MGNFWVNLIEKDRRDKLLLEFVETATVWGFSATEAESIRKAVGKKNSIELAKWKTTFVNHNRILGRGFAGELDELHWKSTAESDAAWNKLIKPLETFFSI